MCSSPPLAFNNFFRDSFDPPPCHSNATNGFNLVLFGGGALLSGGKAGKATVSVWSGKPTCGVAAAPVPSLPCLTQPHRGRPLPAPGRVPTAAQRPAVERPAAPLPDCYGLWCVLLGNGSGSRAAEWTCTCAQVHADTQIHAPVCVHMHSHTQARKHPAPQRHLRMGHVKAPYSHGFVVYRLASFRPIALPLQVRGPMQEAVNCLWVCAI